MQAQARTLLATSLALSVMTGHAMTSDALEEVIVSAEFRPVDALDLATSVSVFNQQAIDDRGARHLDQLLNLAPNVNFASGASRGRFIQIRGTGERSQFVEPVNPSVGLIIDGMDFTGIAGAASTLDVRQVEILRGPQGTLFGANALAGLVNITSNSPTEDFSGRAELSLGDYNSSVLSAALGGMISESWGYRLAAQSNRSDGFIDNLFLGRPTNTLDERTLRGGLHWQAGELFSLDLNLLYSDVDNGYDAFSLDNTRQTWSDQPGHDQLEALGWAARAGWQLGGAFSIEALLSRVSSDARYGYDEDWSHPGICANTPCDSELWGFDWWYVSTDSYDRSNDNTTADARLVSNNDADQVAWVAGLYFREQSQTLLRQYTFGDGAFDSDFDTETLAVYGQLSLPLASNWTTVAGLRFERRDWRFTDNSDALAEDEEDFWGGKLALEYRTGNNTLLYALVSRGYKAGGYNTALASRLPELENDGIALPPESLLFGPETLLNFELGAKGSWMNDSLQLSLAIFYQDRNDMQVKQSIVVATDPLGGACPCTFIDSLQNAAGGANWGVELQGDWQASHAVLLFGSLGLLDTEYRNFESFTHSDADLENGIPYDLSGRDQAHAPQWQYAIGMQVRFAQNWFMQADIEGKDGFYASANHNEQTASYTLFNLRLAWETQRWSIALWGRNLTDEAVQTRGFGGFGNDPRKFYAVEPYYQLGEPRVWGVTGTAFF